VELVVKEIKKMTVAELKKGIALLDETKDNMIIHVVQGYEGNYFILEKTLDCAVGREVIKLPN
jgi:recombinational DNA repair protein RecR